MVGRYPKLLKEGLGVGRCPVVLKADALGRISDELPPAQRDASLDADPRPDTRWQRALLVRRILPRKPFHARHRNHPGGDSILLQSAPGGQRDLLLAAGGDDDYFGFSAAALGQDVAAPHRALRARDAVCAAG